MSFILTLATLVIAFLVVRISQWLYRWSNPKCNGKLPPGSMGFPIIGETSDFFKPFGFFEFPPFVEKRMLRYGPLSRTNIFGSNTLICTDTKVTFEILKQENKSFIIAYPGSFKMIEGKNNLFYKEGNIHMNFKQFSKQLLGSEALKRKMIGDMDRVNREHLRSMAKKGKYDAKHEVSRLITSYLTPKMINNLNPETQANLEKNLLAFNFDWFRGSFNLSAWKAFYTFIRALRGARQVIKGVYKKRKGSKDKYGDYLGSLMEELEKDGTILNEETALSLVFIISIASQESTPAMISLAMIFMSENPEVLAELKLITSYLTPKMINNLNPETQANLEKNLLAFNFDWFRGSFNLSAWKAFYTFIRALRGARQVIKGVYKKRKGSKDKYGDYLGSLMEELEKDGTILNEETALSLVFIISIASQESTPAMISLAMIFMSENPEVLAELKRENEAIIEKRGDKESGVSWEEYRNDMSFTNMVINETLRLGIISPFLFRKAVKDVEIKGYTIPAGWNVILPPAMVHYDPLIYENPFEFNPWRWEGKEVFSGSKTYLAFGGGLRLCPGAEFARLQMAIFLHHLATKYNFSLLEHCEVIRTPMLYFPKGLRIRISTSAI